MADLQSRHEGNVLHLTLNRPEARNAFSAEMRQGLIDQLAVAAGSSEIRAVVLRGADGHFCAGGDVSTQGGQRTGPDSVQRLLYGRRVVEAISNLARPVIAVVEGYAVGAGFSLALASDLVIARDDARFSAIFAKRALVPDMGCTYYLARQVGLHRAKQMVFSGRFVEASEAHDLGIVSHLLPQQGFDDRVESLVAEVANGPTVALATAKRILNRTFESDLSSMLELETLGQALASQTGDHRRSVDAFRSKTTADFNGD